MVTPATQSDARCCRCCAHYLPEIRVVAGPYYSDDLVEMAMPYGECRVQGPSPSVWEGRRWPKVMANDFCSQFKPR